MIVFIRDNECFEPRVQNYLHYFDDHDIDYRVIGWNRNGRAAPNQHIDFFERRAEYGKRIANIPVKLLWMLFAIKKIAQYRKQCTAIHACDIDAVIPALACGKLFHKTVIFDIFDWISSLNGRGIIYSIVEGLQNYSVKHADHVILCEKERKEQIKSANHNMHILPNIPNGKVQLDKETLEKTQRGLEDYQLVISYVGVFDRDRGLENLLESVSERSGVLLNIAGFGVLDDLVRQYSEKYHNIVYWGRVEYAVGQAIIKNSHLMAAMYHLTSPLHRYAAPNKYYESLLLEVPIITTEKTLVASKVEQYDTGFVLDETKEALGRLLDQPRLKQEAEKKKRNCKTTWEQRYSSYFETFMDKEYRSMISSEHR